MPIKKMYCIKNYCPLNFTLHDCCTSIGTAWRWVAVPKRPFPAFVRSSQPDQDVDTGLPREREKQALYILQLQDERERKREDTCGQRSSSLRCWTSASTRKCGSFIWYVAVRARLVVYEWQPTIYVENIQPDLQLVVLISISHRVCVLDRVIIM